MIDYFKKIKEYFFLKKKRGIRPVHWLERERKKRIRSCPLYAFLYRPPRDWTARHHLFRLSYYNYLVSNLFKGIFSCPKNLWYVAVTNPNVGWLLRVKHSTYSVTDMTQLFHVNHYFFNRKLLLLLLLVYFFIWNYY